MLVIVGAFATAVLLILQGVRILRTGVVAPFLTNRSQPGSMRKPAQRVGYSVLYILPGLGIISLLLLTMIKRRITAAKAEAWMGIRAPQLVWLCVIVSFGICSLFWPSIPVGWAKKAHPQLAENSGTALLTTRIIGAGMLGMAILILARL